MPGSPISKIGSSTWTVVLFTVLVIPFIVRFPVTVIFVPTVIEPVVVISPANVALKSDASVKIVSSMSLRAEELLPAARGVADLKTILPPACVPLPAPPCSIKSPQAPLLTIPAASALPAVIVSVLPF